MADVTTLNDQEILDVVRKTIHKFKKRVDEEDANVTVSTGDLIKLLELEAKVSQRCGTKEVRGTWVDPTEVATQSIPAEVTERNPEQVEELHPETK